MVTFQLFARPALLGLQGAAPEATRVQATLGEPVALNGSREQALRVRLEAGSGGWCAALTGAQGSHRLSSMLGADALAILPADREAVAAGERVEVELLPSSAG
jgi:molybdopterin molybdotransferase